MRSRVSVDRPEAPDDPLAFSLAGQFDIPPLGRVPPGLGLRFGGISGLAAHSAGQELFGVSDDRDGLRVYQLAVSGTGSEFRVRIAGQISLDAPASPAGLDPEAIVILPNANLLIASEGIGAAEPRVAPALVEYTRHGAFVRTLPVRDRFVPNPSGPLVTGVRNNMGFESLTLASGGDRIYTAAEAALVQDGEPTTFGPGAPARILEYVRDGGSYEPGREFAYAIDPIEQPAFEVGTAVNGLVELLALGGGKLLSLERTYVAESGQGGRSYNRIRLFHIDLTGASDISSRDSLADLAGVTPVSKQLVLDLSDIVALGPRLQPRLDNFEGLAFGPRLPDGRSTLIIVSDDNFNETQRTWFLQVGIGSTPTGAVRPLLTISGARAGAQRVQ